MKRLALAVVALSLIWPETMAQIALGVVLFIPALIIQIVLELLQGVWPYVLAVLVLFTVPPAIWRIVQKHRAASRQADTKNQERQAELKRRSAEKAWYEERQAAAEAEQKAQRSRQSQEQRESADPPPRDPPPQKEWAVKNRRDALEILELSEPFTAGELKKRWVSMLKQTHPDAGGSTLMTRLVNEAYEVLKAR